MNAHHQRRPATSRPKRAICSALAAAVLLLSGCSYLDRGVVTGKQYYPASDTIIPISTGKGGVVMVPSHTDERWVLYLRDGEKTGEHEVTQQEFDRYNVNDNYP
ncbi:hypothetical protein [Mycobacteroides abscessus]|uniref:hypothetical protein n=1 Tax=Mycobacteroides abscessus TaxID=36809 RepID=UPI0009C794E8|nr:hypothetical protein [Mycobacteroides abscessus]SKU61389.1 Uncharacterised protein [Mycobacteroides abscessus subsp. massiliense]